MRGSSKWHLLTDNLKFGFLVTRDYQAAKEKLEGIFRQNGAIKSMKAPKENLTDIVEYLANGFETSPYPTLEFIKFIQAAKSPKKQNDDQSSELTGPDFEQIENFAVEWQQLITQKNACLRGSEEISPEKTESKGELRRTDEAVVKTFIGKITAEICKKIPIARVNISPETVNYSSADLIIFDSWSGYDDYAMVEKKPSASHETSFANDEDGISFFTIRSYSDAKTQSEKKLVDAFKVARTGVNRFISNEDKINGLYTTLGTMIENKMKFVKPHDTFTIHLPILNPIDEAKLTPDEGAMILNHFAKYTSEWLLKFPNLRIQIQLSPNTKKETIEAAYQLARHEAHASKSVD